MSRRRRHDGITSAQEAVAQSTGLPLYFSARETFFYLIFFKQRVIFHWCFQKVTMDIVVDFSVVCCSGFFSSLFLIVFCLICLQQSKKISFRNTKHVFSFDLCFSSYHQCSCHCSNPPQLFLSTSLLLFFSSKYFVIK